VNIIFNFNKNLLEWTKLPLLDTKVEPAPLQPKKKGSRQAVPGRRLARRTAAPLLPSLQHQLLAPADRERNPLHAAPARGGYGALSRGRRLLQTAAAFDSGDDTTPGGGARCLSTMQAVKPPPNRGPRAAACRSRTQRSYRPTDLILWFPSLQIS
jgi:hypothetical protein